MENSFTTSVVPQASQSASGDSPPSFWNYLYQLQLNGTLCDIQLCIRDYLGELQAIPAHKVVLVSSSHFFRQLLEQDELIDVYNFDGVQPQSLQVALDYMYRQISWAGLMANPEASEISRTLSVIRHDSLGDNIDQYLIDEEGNKVLVVKMTGERRDPTVRGRRGGGGSGGSGGGGGGGSGGGGGGGGSAAAGDKKRRVIVDDIGKELEKHHLGRGRKVSALTQVVAQSPSAAVPGVSSRVVQVQVPGGGVQGAGVVTVIEAESSGTHTVTGLPQSYPAVETPAMGTTAGHIVQAAADEPSVMMTCDDLSPQAQSVPGEAQLLTRMEPIAGDDRQYVVMQSPAAVTHRLPPIDNNAASPVASDNQRTLDINPAANNAGEANTCETNAVPSPSHVDKVSKATINSDVGTVHESHAALDNRPPDQFVHEAEPEWQRTEKPEDISEEAAPDNNDTGTPADSDQPTQPSSHRRESKPVPEEGKSDAGVVRDDSSDKPPAGVSILIDSAIREENSEEKTDADRLDESSSHSTAPPTLDTPPPPPPSAPDTPGVRRPGRPPKCDPSPQSADLTPSRQSKRLRIKKETREPDSDGSLGQRIDGRRIYSRKDPTAEKGITPPSSKTATPSGKTATPSGKTVTCVSVLSAVRREVEAKDLADGKNSLKIPETTPPATRKRGRPRKSEVGTPSPAAAPLKKIKAEPPEDDQQPSVVRTGKRGRPPKKQPVTVSETKNGASSCEPKSESESKDMSKGKKRRSKSQCDGRNGLKDDVTVEVMDAGVCPESQTSEERNATCDGDAEDGESKMCVDDEPEKGGQEGVSRDEHTGEGGRRDTEDTDATAASLCIVMEDGNEAKVEVDKEFLELVARVDKAAAAEDADANGGVSGDQRGVISITPSTVGPKPRRGRASGSRKLQADMQASAAPVQGKHVCLACNKAFKNVTGLSIHEQWKHKKKRDETGTESALGLTEQPCRQPRTCEVCQRVIGSYAALALHMKRKHHLVMSIKCDLCDAEFKTSRRLKDHQSKEHGMAHHTCDKCGASFTSKEGWKIHMFKQHTEADDSHVCDVCGKAFKMKHELTAHMSNTHAPDGLYPCQLCDRSFKMKPSLKRHLQTFHSDVRCHECSECGRRFKTKEDMKAHLALHFRTRKPLGPTGKPSKDPDSQEDLLCRFCGKGFSRAATARAHERVIHGEKQSGVHYICTMCKKSFPVRNYLKQHIRIHHMPKKHKCPQCLYEFTMAYMLRKHMPKCKGFPIVAKPYRCSRCFKYFNLKGNLTKHLQHKRCAALRGPADYVVVLSQDGEPPPSNSQGQPIQISAETLQASEALQQLQASGAASFGQHSLEGALRGQTAEVMEEVHVVGEEVTSGYGYEQDGDASVSLSARDAITRTLEGEGETSLQIVQDSSGPYFGSVIANLPQHLQGRVQAHQRQDGVFVLEIPEDGGDLMEVQRVKDEYENADGVHPKHQGHHHDQLLIQDAHPQQQENPTIAPGSSRLEGSTLASLHGGIVQMTSSSPEERSVQLVQLEDGRLVEVQDAADSGVLRVEVQEDGSFRLVQDVHQDPSPSSSSRSPPPEEDASRQLCLQVKEETNPGAVTAGHLSHIVVDHQATEQSPPLEGATTATGEPVVQFVEEALMEEVFQQSETDGGEQIVVQLAVNPESGQQKWIQLQLPNQ